MLPILFSDKDYLAIDKPSGLMVHPSKVARAATSSVVQLLREQLQARVFPVHRLDRATSGVLLLALSQEAARSIGEQFANGLVEKTYIAITRGVFTGEILLDHPLREVPDMKTDRLARANKPPQEARTNLRGLATLELSVAVDKFPTSRYSLVQASPLTGRKHQVRRHLKHLGHPIIGDVNYGNGKHNRYWRTHCGAHRLLLACTSLSFRLRDQTMVKVEAPLASDFQNLLTEFSWQYADARGEPKQECAQAQNKVSMPNLPTSSEYMSVRRAFSP